VSYYQHNRHKTTVSLSRNVRNARSLVVLEIRHSAIFPQPPNLETRSGRSSQPRGISAPQRTNGFPLLAIPPSLSQSLPPYSRGMLARTGTTALSGIVLVASSLPLISTFDDHRDIIIAVSAKTWNLVAWAPGCSLGFRFHLGLDRLIMHVGGDRCELSNRPTESRGDRAETLPLLLGPVAWHVIRQRF